MQEFVRPHGSSRDAERDETYNPLITQLSDPFPDVDYLCIVTGCYTLVFEIDGVAEGLSFTIASQSDFQHLSLDGSAGTETVTVNGTKKLALCADGDTGEFNHAPTAGPTATEAPTPAPLRVHANPHSNSNCDLLAP